MATNTTNYSFKKPTVSGDSGVWGGYLNDNWDDVDQLLGGNTAITGIDINSGTIDGATIGGTTAAAGSFTTLSASSTFTLGGTAVTSTAAELNLLDGVTATTAELNILDGVTATATELNLLDGVTATTAELNILDGVTATATELNILDGVTATATELNLLDGVTATTAELNYLDITTLGTTEASKAVTADANVKTTFAGTVSVQEIIEKVDADTSTTGTINFNVLDGAVANYTANQTANRTINFRGNMSTSLDSTLAVDESVTVAIAMAQGTTAYYLNTYQIDGSAVTPKWQGGTAPSGGNASSIDVYSFTIIKTASATFTVLASQSKFA